MEKFSLEKRIPSCFVNKKLIEQLEKYIKTRLAKKLHASLSLQDAYKDIFSLGIKDGFGEEQLDSIDTYHKDKFSNDTEVIYISYSLNYSDLRIKLRFSKEYALSYLAIDLECEGAKEIVQGIYNEIISIIKDNKTIHSLFYNNYASAVYFALSFTIISRPWLKFQFSEQIFNFILMFSLGYWAIRYISPYTTFDTSKNDKRKEAIKWVLNGLAGVFLFGVLATFVRDVLLQ